MRSPAQHIAVPSLERGERRIVGSGEVQLSVGQAEGREVEFRAVLEHLRAGGEVVDRSGLRRPTRAPPGASRLQLRCLSGGKLSVLGVDGSRPSRRAAGDR